MKLSEIIGGYNVKCFPINIGDIIIDTLFFDSKKKVKNGLYFCLNGSKIDGHNFAFESVSNGGVCLVVERLLKVNVPQILVNDTRDALANFSANFYDNPQNKMKFVGVVGTNGKTSTTKIIGEVMNNAKINTAVIGTLGVFYNGKVVNTNFTTPDPVELNYLLNDMALSGVKCVCMELSAHAIYLKKTSTINFDVLVFTNCTHDHLDYFGDFEKYKNVKKSAFNNKVKYFVLNVDDELTNEILQGNISKSITYGIDNPCDVFAMDIKLNESFTRYTLNLFDLVFTINTKLLGKFNVYNQLGSICACFLLGIKPNKIIEGITKISPIEGRMEKFISPNGGSIFIDYAHTPDGLEKSLSFVNSVTRGDVTCLFGCGGDRDNKKRKLMGRIAGDMADFVIITSDNPRSEDPLNIIKEIELGVKESTLDYTYYVDRKVAIKNGIIGLKNGDSLLIAGRGGEKEQEINGEFLPFDDKKVVLECIYSIYSGGDKID